MQILIHLPTHNHILVHDSFALGENDFMHHLYSTTHLYSLQPTFNIEVPESQLRNGWITIPLLTLQATLYFNQRQTGGRKEMASDLMPAHPTFKHKRNLIVLPSLLLHDLDIYGIKKRNLAAETGTEEK